MTVRFIQGDTLEKLREMKADSVHCIVTSPPFWGLRDYGTASWEGGDAICTHIKEANYTSSTLGASTGGRSDETHKRSVEAQTTPYRSICGKCGARRIDQQYGLEPTLAEYVARMVEVGRELRRVLRPDGVLWWEHGDSYSSGSGGDRKIGENDETRARARPKVSEFASKQLLGQPWRIAFAFQEDGWWLRSANIWHRPNPMPESVQGSQFVRHRVTISDYERLSGVRYSGSGGDGHGASNLPDLSAREVPNSQAKISAERERQGDSQSAGRTTGSAGKEANSFEKCPGESKQEEVRSDTKREDNADEGYKEVPRERPRKEDDGVKASCDEEQPAQNFAEGGGGSKIPTNGKICSVETAPIREDESGNRAAPSCDSRRLVGDCQPPQEPLSLLQEAQEVDSRPCDPSEQRRETRSGKHSAGVPELQLNEGRQDNSSMLIDCPGCHLCNQHNGYILRMNAGRTTTAHSYVFMFTKSERYFYDAEAVKERATGRDPGSVSPHKHDDGTALNRTKAGLTAIGPKESRNLRSVWTIATETCSESHFAIMASEVARRCIAAGTSERGCCPTCGAPWARVVERVSPPEYDGGKAAMLRATKRANHRSAQGPPGNGLGVQPTATVGFHASCTCRNNFENILRPIPCSVLDPFSGAGTTAMVADRLGRDAIGIELSAEYITIAERRVALDRLERGTGRMADVAVGLQPTPFELLIGQYNDNAGR